ncbi:hypothetical protein [Candidatus Litorirhabdus singularis]|uniref:hypothetical protein n=1 Tax=Candidatus Litorirhabdus singularis TaxID=2518993 RepID=UPI0024311B98|nr:hypothetical protein [Candidatus Litorirhabdus singularis]
MCRLRTEYRVIPLALMIVSAVMLLLCSGQAAAASSLSQWLSGKAIPELRHQMATHPRFQGAQLQLDAGAEDTLTAALVTVLRKNLSALPQLSAELSGPTGLPRGTGASIDALHCNSAANVDYRLRVQVMPGQRGLRTVQLALVEIASAGRIVESWTWSGKLSRGERQYAAQAATGAADGSLGAPWQPAQVEQAAAELSYQLACELRPHVQQRLSLQTVSGTGLPATVRETLAASTQLLAAFRELEVSPSGTDYQLGVTMTPFRDGIWQLWLEAAPGSVNLGHAQAVTYLQLPKNASAMDTDVRKQQRIAEPREFNAEPLPVPPGSPREYLQVALVEAAQQDRSGARADLLLTLELQNRATVPMAYSLTTSGGHFNHCIARSGNYRHDAYGNVEGVIAAGATILRRLRVTDARHRPTPLLGARSCAGFRDLKAFEQYAQYGQSVTDYVRWEY